MERWPLDINDKVHYLWIYHGVWEKHAAFQKGPVSPLPILDATTLYFLSHFQQKGTTQAEYPMCAVVKEKRRKSRMTQATPKSVTKTRQSPRAALCSQA